MPEEQSYHMGHQRALQHVQALRRIVQPQLGWPATTFVSAVCLRLWTHWWFCLYLFSSCVGLLSYKRPVITPWAHERTSRGRAHERTSRRRSCACSPCLEFHFIFVWPSVNAILLHAVVDLCNSISNIDHPFRPPSCFYQPTCRVADALKVRCN